LRETFGVEKDLTAHELYKEGGKSEKLGE